MPRSIPSFPGVAQECTFQPKIHTKPATPEAGSPVVVRGLGRYVAPFAAFPVDGECLVHAEAADLEEAGMGAAMHRKKLMAKIAEMAQPPPSTPPRRASGVSAGTPPPSTPPPRQNVGSGTPPGFDATRAP